MIKDIKKVGLMEREVKANSLPIEMIVVEASGSLAIICIALLDEFIEAVIISVLLLLLLLLLLVILLILLLLLVILLLLLLVILVILII
jgi:hypothetical protein